MLCEWNGYLVVLVDGCIFLADSRQKYTHAIGVPQYEWYFLEGIGVYSGQYTEYKYSAKSRDELLTATVEHDGRELPLTINSELSGQSINSSDSYAEVYEDGENGLLYSLSDDGALAYLCDKPGNYIGGDFKPAAVIKTLDGNLFFGTENGVVCSFNFDMRNEEGEIPATAYSFDGRIILSGCATKMDSCDIPHLTKSTVKKSTVIKTKTLPRSSAKLKVRTNRKPYEQIARITSTSFTFEDMDFEDFSFSSIEQSLFAVKEKEKKWVEKQYYIYSDEFMRPFALFYVTYRYTVTGRFKE